MLLVLDAAEVAGRYGWRWLLLDGESGTPLADNIVRLDPGAADTEAFLDVYRFVRWEAAPDRRVASEAALVGRVGAFIGANVLGERVGRAIVDHAPVTVRVRVPATAEWLAFLPWELAHVDGRPLAARGDVCLAYDLAAGGAGAPQKAPVGAALRVLGVFSLPADGSALGLRRERYGLTQLVRRIGAAGRRVELVVAQYGVTRDRLAALAGDRAGWDVLHLSGHGATGQFLLEKADGSPDPVSTEDLMGLLGAARGRVKLAVASACQSAAATTAETLRWLGLDQQAEPLEEKAKTETAAAAAAQSAVAQALRAQLGCAVVAMRYPVADDFAVAFAGQLYDRLLAHGQPVDQAFAGAVAVAAGPVPSAGRPALSVGTPALFGASAVDLSLSPPTGKPALDQAEIKMAGFAPEPERFVGRAAAMAAANQVLSPGSGRTALVLHGIPGAGKTACALELAYRHQASFAACAYWRAPANRDESADALRLLAASLEGQLRDLGFALLDKIASPESLEAFLPKLQEILRRNALLLVLDNLESLLTETGTWRDPRLSRLIAAFTRHGGDSRLILTSRVFPAGLDPAQVLVEPVHALSRDESLLLARELPHLGKLLQSEPTTEPDHVAAPQAPAPAGRDLAERELAVRAVTLVAGLPELLELADAAAADPPQLVAALAAAQAADEGAELSAFLTSGTAADGRQFLATLTAWTAAATAAVPDEPRLLLRILSRIDDADRSSQIAEAIWAELWRHLATPGDPPPFEQAINPLVTAALVATEAIDPSQPDGPVGYRIHPSAAHATHATTPAELATAVDVQLAGWWTARASYAIHEINAGREATELLVRAGTAAATYLIRLHEWNTATALLDRARGADARSPDTAHAVIPPLRRIAETTGDPDAVVALAKALTTVDPGQAAKVLYTGYAQAVAAGDHRRAAAFAGNLINLLIDRGHLNEALSLAGDRAAHTRAAGLGPWTQLLDQVQRLQILGMTGQHEQVLQELPALIEQMASLPGQPGESEAVNPWNVREVLLDVGRASAFALERWQNALDFNVGILMSRQQRGATDHEIACTLYNDIGPLRRLGRLPEADQLLLDCQQVFEDAGDMEKLGKVFSARASLEAERGHHEEAIRLGRDALRLEYLRADPRGVALCHYNLANALLGTGGRPAEQRAHRIAAALTAFLMDDGYSFTIFLKPLAREVRGPATANPGGPPLPTTLAEVIALVDAKDGVYYADLVGALTRDPEAADQALHALLATAATIKLPTQPPDAEPAAPDAEPAAPDAEPAAPDAEPAAPDAAPAQSGVAGDLADSIEHAAAAIRSDEPFPLGLSGGKRRRLTRRAADRGRAAVAPHWRRSTDQLPNLALFQMSSSFGQQDADRLHRLLSAVLARTSHGHRSTDAAYPGLDMPDQVAPGEEFTVTVGLRADPDTALVSTGAMDLPVSDVDVQVALQFDPLAFAPVGVSGPVTLRRTATDRWPSVDFQLIARASKELRAERRIDVKFLRNCQLIGFASRAVVVRSPGAASLGDALSRPAATASTGTPAPAAEMLDLRALLDDEVDLIIVIRPSADVGGTRLVFTAHSRHADVEDRAEPLTEVLEGEHAAGTTPQQLGKDARLKVSTTSDERDLFTWLRGLGDRIYRSLPLEICAALRTAVAKGTAAAPATILLFSEEPYVPWELAVDPDGWPSAVETTAPFLGAHAAISRWFLGERPPPERRPAATVEVHQKVLVSAHYEGVVGWTALPEAEAEVRKLAVALAPGVTIVKPDMDDVLNLLEGTPPAELLHFALHGKFDPQGIQGGLVLIRMTDGRPAPQFLQENHVRGRRLRQQPFVYLNACQVAVGSNEVLGDYGGLAAAFLAADARGVLAPLWNIEDATASALASEFYSLSTGDDPLPAAEIVRRFRARYTPEAVRDHKPGVNATLVAFQLFGHPRLRLFRQVAPVPEVPHG
jgi:tetratricopeptide (TPR) repeat protein